MLLTRRVERPTPGWEISFANSYKGMRLEGSLAVFVTDGGEVLLHENPGNTPPPWWEPPDRA